MVIIMKTIIKLYKDQRGGGSATVAVKCIVLTTFFMLMMFVLIDFYYLANIYRYVKNQQDLSNRAVFAELDRMKMADREIYIDENSGLTKFKQYITKNLELDSSNIPGRDIRLVGSVTIKEFQIYNTNEPPAVTPNGENVSLTAVYSQIEVEIRPFLVGLFGNITFSPRLTTDIPDKLMRTFHP